MAAKLSRQDVLDILDIIDRSDFDEIHIEMEDVKISVVKAGASALRDRSASSSISVPMSDPSPAQLQAAAVPTAAADPDVVELPAPMLGVFFHAPKPGADPYVHPGSRIEPDTLIGIIEVMKFMNPIQAGIAGEVIEVVAPDGQLVEFGQVLLRVRRDR